MNQKCLHPVEAWICGSTVCKSDGVTSPNLVFSRVKARHYFFDHAPRGDFFDDTVGVLGRLRFVDRMMRECCVLMPCGKCAACQIEKRKDMSVRLAHEASMYEDCCFVTLTYNEQNVPRGEHGHRTLLPSDLQKFMKRLRRHLEYQPVRKSKGVRDHVRRIRYFAVGEYGGKTHRPHYHMIIFGWKPSDLVLHKMYKGNPVYRSKQLEDKWTLGFSSVSEVNPKVAKYCARYVTKKIAHIDNDDFPNDVIPEFFLQSTRDGAIGAKWFDSFGRAACELGFVTYRCDLKVYKAAVPKYYMSRLRKFHVRTWLNVRDERIKFINREREKESRLSAAELVKMRELAIDAIYRSVNTNRFWDEVRDAEEVDWKRVNDEFF